MSVSLDYIINMESAGQEVSGEVYASQVKLFGKWNCDEVDVDDISLKVI